MLVPYWILCRIVVQYLFCRKREQRHNRNNSKRFQSHDVILSHSFVKSNQINKHVVANFASWIFSGVLCRGFIHQRYFFSRIECQTIIFFLFLLFEFHFSKQPRFLPCLQTHKTITRRVRYCYARLKASRKNGTVAIKRLRLINTPLENVY